MTYFNLDIDECNSTDNGGCEHYCINAPGYYYCKCLLDMVCYIISTTVQVVHCNTCMIIDFYKQLINAIMVQVAVSIFVNIFLVLISAHVRMDILLLLISTNV